MDSQAPALIPITEQPYNAETPLAVLGRAPTPTELFYVRSHFPVPAADASWRLRVGGAVRAPLALTLDDVRSLPATTLRMTMECAGNGRKGIRPPTPGTPWGLGAVSTADFTGTPLRPVLERCGVSADAVEVLFRGADGDGEYARSLPLDDALNADTLLVWEMNGRPLTPHHGAPLRLLVPGWYAMASVKWLAEIQVLAEVFRGTFQSEDYVYTYPGGVPAPEPVTRVRVRSLITHPLADAALPAGEVEVSGIAWSGSGAIDRVEVSCDAGRSWDAARVEEPSYPHAAQAWSFSWRPDAPGDHVLLARATDAAGNRQPERPVSTLLGYGNNASQPVRVSVR
jgi:DMSO/TMAO reductase YedYZ molybdopterin-dependent catalytic subunit